MASPTVKLNSGYDMPLVGFGLWKVTNDTCADQVYEAVKAGYRLFDGACDYGNESACGEGIARAIADGLVTREELFIVSKLWNTFHEAERVAPICKKQLDDWHIEYFDLYLVHFPVALEYVDPSVRYPPGWMSPKQGTMGEGKEEEGKGKKEGLVFSNASIQETWQALEGLVDAGLARSIGVSNFSAQLLMDVLRYARIRPATLQIEHHPYLTQERLVEYAMREGIRVTAYSSFGPLGFLELEMEKAKQAPGLLEHEVVREVAARTGRTPAQVLLRWATQRGVAVIPKSSHGQRMRENLDVTGWELSGEEVRRISALDRGLRFNDPIGYGMYVPIF